MEVLHDTPFKASLDSILDKDGSEARVAVLKATYDIRPDGTLRVAEKQVLVTVTDEFFGDPATSSPADQGDGALFKPDTDVVVIGRVYTPGGKPATEVDASVSLGQVSAAVRVAGDRTWAGSVVGVKATPPATFTEMPITWGRSFGGIDATDPDPKRHRWDARNPAGTGFRSSRTDLEGLALPNFEDPRHPMSNWNDKPTPRGFGFIGRGWEPRLRYVGTYDDAWQKNRMPILPTDFDYRYFNGAPPGLIHPGHLRGGEEVRMVNLSRRGTEAFRLPRVRVRFRVVAKRKRQVVDASLDTVRLLTDGPRVVLLWRSKYAVALNEAADEVMLLLETER